MMGIPRLLHSLLFSDDQDIFAQEKEDTEYKIRKLKNWYGLWRRKKHMYETEYLCTGSKVAD